MIYFRSQRYQIDEIVFNFVSLCCRGHQISMFSFFTCFKSCMALIVNSYFVVF
jgi:hypothetical protein